MTGRDVVDVPHVPGRPAAALAAAVDEALAAGARRVQTLVPALDGDAHRAAARAGLRREGLLRALAGPSPDGDRVLFARLADDPAADTREGRSGVLDTTMPVKRVVAQGLLRDPQGRVLVCETTYKRDWDLPGGIVDPDESPADTVAREVREELGLDLPVGRLLALSWMPRYYGWSDALQLVYDLGVADAGLVDRAVLSPHEIRAVHWVHDTSRCAPYERRVIAQALAVGPADRPADLRDGVPR